MLKQEHASQRSPPKDSSLGLGHSTGTAVSQESTRACTLCCLNSLIDPVTHTKKKTILWIQSALTSGSYWQSSSIRVQRNKCGLSHGRKSRCQEKVSFLYLEWIETGKLRSKGDWLAQTATRLPLSEGGVFALVALINSVCWSCHFSFVAKLR